MQAEIITIGDELLIGQVIDTNSAWMGEQLSLIGIKTTRITTISDTEEAIMQALTEAESRSDLVLITGGLGPTKDDITKHTLCQFFETDLVLHQDILDTISEAFKARDIPMLPVHTLQAQLPRTCTVIRNWQGTASGMWFERNGKVFVSMPGVPYEMKGMMSKDILPKISSFFATGTIIHKTIITQGIGESSLAEQTKEWVADIEAAGIKLAYLPSTGQVRLRMTAFGVDEAALEQLLEEKTNLLIDLVPKYIVGFGETKIEDRIGELLKLNNATLSAAESCTGGYISHLITSVPGSSAYYPGSVISYSNQVKMQELGVRAETLQAVGAVSEEVVEQMVLGVQKKFNTTHAIAVSGIAGPDGGSDEKPVGTVWIAVAHYNKVITQKFNFGKNRERNIRNAALAALNMLRRSLLDL